MGGGLGSACAVCPAAVQAVRKVSRAPPLAYPRPRLWHRLPSFTPLFHILFILLYHFVIYLEPGAPRCVGPGRAPAASHWPEARGGQADGVPAQRPPGTPLGPEVHGAVLLGGHGQGQRRQPVNGAAVGAAGVTLADSAPRHHVGTRPEGRGVCPRGFVAAPGTVSRRRRWGPPGPVCRETGGSPESTQSDARSHPMCPGTRAPRGRRPGTRRRLGAQLGRWPFRVQRVAEAARGPWRRSWGRKGCASGLR